MIELNFTIHRKGSNSRLTYVSSTRSALVKGSTLKNRVVEVEKRIFSQRMRASISFELSNFSSVAIRWTVERTVVERQEPLSILLPSFKGLKLF